MKLSLVVLTPGKQEGKAIPITLAQFLIGRDPQCHLRPASPAISKRHCAVLVKNGKIFIRDFDSTNGTFVNDEAVKGERELKNGDKLKAGPLLFEVRVEATEPAAAKPAAPAAAKVAVGAREPAVKTPATTSRTAGAVASNGDDDDIAAMLLSLQDDDGSGSGSSEEIPEGSTVMEIALPKDLQSGDGTDPGTKTDGTATGDKMTQAKANQASTSSAAKAILEQYMKRPRG